MAAVGSRLVELICGPIHTSQVHVSRQTGDPYLWPIKLHGFALYVSEGIEYLRHVKGGSLRGVERLSFPPRRWIALSLELDLAICD